MCGSKPKAPSNPPPPPPPPPPPEQPIQMAPATSDEATRSASKSIEAKKKGRAALKIDLQTGTQGGTGLNVPKG